MQHIKYLLLVFIPLSLILSCTRELPRSPREAFAETSRAVQNGDAERFYDLISDESKKELTDTVKSINSMPEKQRTELEKKDILYTKGIVEEKEFLSAWIKKERTTNPMLISLSRTILMIDENNGKAKVRLDNGIELLFEKEGLYWKLSLKGK